MKTSFDLQDFTLRVLILVAGGLAAALLALKGHAEAIPGLALGGTLGAFVVSRLSTTEN